MVTGMLIVLSRELGLVIKLMNNCEYIVLFFVGEKIRVLKEVLSLQQLLCWSIFTFN